MRKKFYLPIEHLRSLWTCKAQARSIRRSTRLAAALALIAAHSVSTVFAQKMNLSFKNTSMKDVLKEIRVQTGYQIVYSADLLENTAPVTFEGNAVELIEVLNRTVRNQGLDYTIQENTIVIRPAQQAQYTAPSPAVQAQAQGQVTDGDGRPLAGVTVTEQGTTNRVVTDQEGNFSIQVSNAEAVLVFTSVGYNSTRQAVSTGRMVIAMSEEDLALEEIVVVGYGTQKKEHLTGAVSSVSGEDLASRPVQNVGQALQGMVPGLNVQTSGMGGQLNQNMNINIRGAGTIGVGSTSSPLVLIDGMEGDMNTINSQDIENITVLKDAAASAIYGSRAPFGVILITTKSGKSGKVIANYNTNVRLGQPRGLPTMLDSRKFAYYFNKVAANDGEAAKFSQEVLDRIEAYQRGEISTVAEANNSNRWEYYTGSNANTDWFEEFYRDFTTSHEHTLSLSGERKN